jgi:hypothetical protein
MGYMSIFSDLIVVFYFVAAVLAVCIMILLVQVLRLTVQALNKYLQS